MLKSLRASLLAALCAACTTPASTAQNVVRQTSCEAGSWLEPATGEILSYDSVLAKAVESGVVMLGESHDNPQHHLWQLSTMAALLGRNEEMVIGFEMFPQRTQPVLDRWSAGELSREEFLEDVEWDKVWSMDAELYLPLFDFARIHRLPIVALNVERSLVSKVGAEGWKAVPATEREGVGDPAPALEAYRDRLSSVYRQHSPEIRAEDREKNDEADQAFERFVEAQLTWDRAMAEALAKARARPERPLVVGIMGQEHVRSGYGIPHQLEDLGIAESTVLLPLDLPEGCEEIGTALADAVFVLDPPVRSGTPRPRLGVILGSKDEEVEVSRVADGSVGQASGLEPGDVILEAGGIALSENADLVEIVGRQPPGTWLPLVVKRGDQQLEIVAKFPAAETEGR